MGLDANSAKAMCRNRRVKGAQGDKSGPILRGDSSHSNDR
jgi:hypothetical protein